MGKMRPLTVVLTSAGTSGAPSIIKSLRVNGKRRIKIVGTDMNPQAIGLYMADKSYVVPPASSPEYIPYMVEIAREEDADVIIPLATNELLPLADNRDKFEKIGTKVAVSSPDPLRVATDRASLCEHLNARGVPTPGFCLVRSIEEFGAAVSALGYPDAPVVFKPVRGKEGRGFRVLDQNADKLDLLLNHKPTQAITTLDDVLPVLELADPFPELVVMEYLPGVEYSVDLLMKDGKSLITIPCPREIMKLGICFIGYVEKNPEVAKMAEDICREVGLEGNINVQLKYSREAQPRVIEINPRVSGTLIMCHGAGVNMPYLGLKLALGEPVYLARPRYGTRMIRYWEEIFLSPDGRPYQIHTSEINHGWRKYNRAG